MNWREYEHAFNEQVYKNWRNGSWREVRAEAAYAYAKFLAAAEAVPEEILFRTDRPAWEFVAFNGYLHYLDFSDVIKAWLDR